MKAVVIRLFRLFFGLFLYAAGIVLTMQAHIGYAPWEVFHAGLAKVLGLQIGTVSILVGLVIGIAVMLFGEPLGFGTVCNMVVVGLFMNILLGSGLFAELSNPVLGVVQLIAGLFVISLASYFYISSGFGAGPRDSLMVLLSRKTKFSVGTCRGAMEVSVTLVGFLMGGLLGWGTLLSAVLIGFCIQITFKVLLFDPKKVVHEDFVSSYRKLGLFMQAQNINKKV
ncbi:Uncharacterized membrane protein YczE [Sphaerochaeta associata]|uniref:Membrane protein YczE n=1 Tax=Sphaerochaeta associata TaxID=1129264 RepID=A0ABY4D668_9SPIR|nr:hypothetical protein [Sphaerochaeta associata]UOM49661.1 hypothetical protein MUG09_08845 [Sphaerochaeta associata]SMP48871.1 Uncharacterized membrane protein YczE [Sphaerochaeta associata]